jgi:hypothetical protein
MISRARVAEASRRRFDLDEAFHDEVEAKTEGAEAHENSRVGQQPRRQLRKAEYASSA